MSQAIAKQAPVRLELRRTNRIELDEDANDAWSLGRAVQHFFRRRLLLIVVLGIGTLPALCRYPVGQCLSGISFRRRRAY